MSAAYRTIPLGSRMMEQIELNKAVWFVNSKNEGLMYFIIRDKFIQYCIQYLSSLQLYS